MLTLYSQIFTVSTAEDSVTCLHMHTTARRTDAAMEMENGVETYHQPDHESMRDDDFPKWP